MVRPKKYKDVRYSYITFYYPRTIDHEIVFKEFRKLILQLYGNKDEYYSKNDKTKIGTFFRRFIYNTVVKKSEDTNMQTRAFDLLQQEVNYCKEAKIKDIMEKDKKDKPKSKRGDNIEEESDEIDYGIEEPSKEDIEQLDDIKELEEVEGEEDV